jgi:hypothetical protein
VSLFEGCEVLHRCFMRIKVPSTTTLSFPTFSPLLTAGKNIVWYFLDRLCITSTCCTFNIGLPSHIHTYIHAYVRDRPDCWPLHHDLRWFIVYVRERKREFPSKLQGVSDAKPVKCAFLPRKSHMDCMCCRVLFLIYLLASKGELNG